MNIPDRELNDDFVNEPHIEESALSAMKYAEPFVEWLNKFGGVEASRVPSLVTAIIIINGDEYRMKSNGDLSEWQDGAIESLYYVYQNYGDCLK